MLAVLAAVAGAVGGLAIVELRRFRRDTAILRIVRTVAPAAAGAREDPRQLLAWFPVARACRRLFPDAFTELDVAFGATFPFSPEDVQAAHARWTADWLAWERAHDAEYKLKVAALEEELERRGEQTSPVGRARLQAIEREMLERYQQRYEEYIRTAKALAALGKDGRSRFP